MQFISPIQPDAQAYPAVSVIIPSYNHSQYILQAIESVLAQQSVRLDLIVIDDGSRDGSTEKIHKFWAERNGFRFVARENRGLILTLNQGLELATGEFVCELASDDYLPPDSLRLRAEFLRAHPECVAVFADGTLVQGNEDTGTRFLGRKSRRMLRSADPVSAMIEGDRPVFSTGLIRTGILREIGGFDAQNFRFYEDLDTPIRLALAGKIGFLDAPVICRRLHETNVSTSTSHIRLEKLLCYRKLLAEPKCAPYKETIRKQLVREYLKLGRHLARGKKGSDKEYLAFRDALKFVKYDMRLLWYSAVVSQRFAKAS